jgi:hypothetical protein
VLARQSKAGERIPGIFFMKGLKRRQPVRALLLLGVFFVHACGLKN